MTTIAGFADGILDGTIPKSEEDKYLAAIADETRRLSRLVRSMQTGTVGAPFCDFIVSHQRLNLKNIL